MTPLEAITLALETLEPGRIDHADRALVILFALDVYGFTVLRDTVVPHAA